MRKTYKKVKLACADVLFWWV